jgi:hypothetical protein
MPTSMSLRGSSGPVVLTFTVTAHPHSTRHPRGCPSNPNIAPLLLPTSTTQPRSTFSLQQDQILNLQSNDSQAALCCTLEPVLHPLYFVAPTLRNRRTANNNAKYQPSRRQYHAWSHRRCGSGDNHQCHSSRCNHIAHGHVLLYKQATQARAARNQWDPS